MAKRKSQVGIDTKASTPTGNAVPDISGMIKISDRFALLNRLISRDLNNNTSRPTFALYSKDNISKYLSNPYTYEKELRKAAIYIYGASSHFRRLIQYFESLSDMCYVVSPYKIDPKTQNKKTINRNYRRVLDVMSAMNVKTQFPKILRVCLREDVYYGTMWVTKDNITIQRLPSDYCAIATIEGNVANVSFDFSYFDSRQNLLSYYPEEFRKKYAIYQQNKKQQWLELDCPTSFAIKANDDILDYSIPPFAGIFREVYEIEDYKQLKLSKAAIDNYAMIVMKLPMDDNGNWLMDFGKAKEFWQNLDSVLPEEIGSILTPMDVDKIGFEKSHTASTNTVAEAEEELFSAAGVSSLLFNNTKASANALQLSIKADQALTYNIVKGLEDVVNRYIQFQSFGKNFKVNFLDVSAFNRKEVGDMYLKAAQYGLPTVSMYAASQGLGQAELDSMNFLENDVLEIKKLFVPLKSSATQSGKVDAGEGGAPQKDADELTESGLQNREDA